MSKIDKVASQKEVLIQLVDKSRHHQTKHPGDVCIGMMDSQEGQYILWSTHYKGNLCIGENFKAKKLGFLPWREVEDYLKKYGKTEEPEKVPGEEGSPKLLTREQLTPALDTMLSIARNPSEGASTLPQKQISDEKVIDPEKVARAIHFIEKGIDDPEIKQEAQKNSFTVRPDGHVEFDHPSKVQETLHGLYNVIVTPVPAAMLLGADLSLLTVGKIAQPGYNPGDEGVPVLVPFKEWIDNKLLFKPRQELSDEEKQGIMEETFKERVTQAKEFKEISCKYALNHAWDDLEKVWENPTLTLDYKKNYLFCRWDETLEDEDGAKQMRQLITDFIKTTLPPQSPQAYTSEEVEDFRSIQESKDPFDPYKILD